MEDMKPSYMCEECCAAAEALRVHRMGLQLPALPFSTNHQGDAPPLGRDLFTYDQLAGHFPAAFKHNQALHDLRLSQIKASLARITDLNILKEHLLICEHGNWADEVTTMIVERQIEIMHPAPAPQRRQELSAFSALAANKPDLAKAVKWDKWNQLMPYVQEIVSKQFSVSSLQDIRLIVAANTTSLSLLRTTVDGAIIAAKARESKARESRIISSRLPQGITIPTQDVVDRFQATLSAAGHRVLENASVHSTTGAIIDPGARVITLHSLWIGSSANLDAIGVPINAPGQSDQSITATRNFLMKLSEAVEKAPSPSSSTNSLPDLVPMSSPGSPTSATYKMLYQDLTSDSNNLSRSY
ncbi:hypothetical protein B0H14DRAFT_3458029 [Mycena olivaceomarginata]|nr:hypothetical protein B0H14DRAFT_3458029 [Mycena olivaceomarginata]